MRGELKVVRNDALADDLKRRLPGDAARAETVDHECGDAPPFEGGGPFPDIGAGRTLQPAAAMLEYQGRRWTACFRRQIDLARHHRFRCLMSQELAQRSRR